MKNIDFQIRDLGNDNYNDIIYVDEWGVEKDEITAEELYNTLCSLYFACLIKAKRYLTIENIHLGDLQLSSKNYVCSYKESHRVIVSNRIIRRYMWYDYNPFMWNEDKYRQLLNIFRFYFGVLSPIKICPDKNMGSVIGIYVDKKEYGRQKEYLEAVNNYLKRDSVDKIYLYDSERLLENQLAEIKNIEIVNLSHENKEKCIHSFCTCDFFIGTASPFFYIVNIFKETMGCLGDIQAIESKQCADLYLIAEAYPGNIENEQYEGFCAERERNPHLTFSKYMGQFSALCFGEDSLVRRIIREGIHKVAIYGLGVIGRMLYFYLKAYEDIQIEYVADKSVTEADDILLIHPAQINSQKAVDAIIVSPIFHIEDICQELYENGVVEPIIPLEYFIYK